VAEDDRTVRVPARVTKTYVMIPSIEMKSREVGSRAIDGGVLPEMNRGVHGVNEGRLSREHSRLKGVVSLLLNSRSRQRTRSREP
jgi:hypothetical protein